MIDTVKYQLHIFIISESFSSKYSENNIDGRKMLLRKLLIDWTKMRSCKLQKYEFRIPCKRKHFLRKSLLYALPYL